MEVITVNKGDTLGGIAASRGLKGKEKAAFISSVMELNGIKEARLLQIGDLKLPENSIFKKEEKAFAELEKSEAPAQSDAGVEKAPKPTIGERFANWQTDAVVTSVKAHNKAKADIAEYDANNSDANATYRKARVHNANVEIAKTRDNIKGFTFVGGSFDKALLSGDEEKAKKLYVQGLSRLSASYIDELEEGGTLSKEAFVAQDMAYTSKVDFKVADKADSERMFDCVDLDGDGKLTGGELNNLFAWTDHNSETGHNGRISFKDYANVRTQLVDETKTDANRAELTAMADFLKAKPKAKEEPASQQAPFYSKEDKELSDFLIKAYLG